MLLGDRDLTALPALAELVQVGEHDLAEQRVERRGCSSESSTAWADGSSNASSACAEIA